MRLDAFAAALARLGVGAADTVAVALSGGPDSLALLWLAAVERPGQVHALTVDHRLRPESSAEAAAAGRAAAGLGVPHATLVWETGPGPGNLPDAARRARYQLMARWCGGAGVRWLMTAHHSDDQAETMLMRLARGSGLNGLSGIRARRPLADGVTLIRPLLRERKAALAAVVASAGLTPVDDPSNRDPARDRTAARALLAATPWLDPDRIAHAARCLADAQDALAWAAHRAWDGRAEACENAVTIDAEGLPRELRLRLLARALAGARGTEPDGGDVARLLDCLDAGNAGTLGQTHAAPGPPWRFTPAPPRRGTG